MVRGFSDSDSEEERAIVSIEAAYIALDIRGGLQDAATYCTAVAELQCIVSSLYTGRSFSKRSRSLVEDDVARAVTLQIDSERGRKALEELMRAVDRALPQSKRVALIRQHKQAAVAATRSRRPGSAAGGGGGGDGEGAAAAAPLLQELPRECVDVVLCHLDPVTLAQAACVCRAWRAAAAADALWRPHLARTFGAAAAAADDADAGARQAAPAASRSACSSLSAAPAGTAAPGPSGHHPAAPDGGGGGGAARRFAALAALAPGWLAPWRTSRVAFPARGGVRWMSAATWRRLLAAHPAPPLGMAATPNLVFLSPGEVAVWLDRRTRATLVQFQAGRRAEAAAVAGWARRGGGAAAGAAAAAASAARLGAMRFWAR